MPHLRERLKGKGEGRSFRRVRGLPPEEQGRGDPLPRSAPLRRGTCVCSSSTSVDTRYDIGIRSLTSKTTKTNTHSSTCITTPSSIGTNVRSFTSTCSRVST